MVTTAAQLKKLQREMEALKKKVARLERKDDGPKPARRKITRGLSERERVEEALRDAGLLAELTTEEKARAAHWRALPEEEKRRIRDELWNLKLDKPLSQIIIENR